MKTVRFPAPSKEYDVVIGNGAVSVLGFEVKKLCPGAVKALIVSETNVAPLYLDRVRQELVKAGIEAVDHVFEAGERSKGIEAVAGEFPQVIKEVRGRGMMIGMDLTKEGAGGMLMALMIDHHIIVAYTLNNPKVIRIEPPLIMPKPVVDHVLEVLRDCIRQVADAIDDL